MFVYIYKYIYNKIISRKICFLKNIYLRLFYNNMKNTFLPF